MDQIPFYDQKYILSKIDSHYVDTFIMTPNSYDNYKTGILTAQGCKKDLIHVLCIEYNGILERLIQQESLLATNIQQLVEPEIQFSFSSIH